MASLILASSEDNGIIRQGDNLYSRNNFVPDKQFEVNDIDLFIKAAVAKWGLYRVVGKDNKTSPEITDKGLPKMELIKLPNGEYVYHIVEEGR